MRQGCLPPTGRPGCGALGEVAEDGGRTQRAAPPDGAVLHGRQILCLVEDDVTDTADPFDEVNRLVHQHCVRESPAQPTGSAGGRRLQQECLLSRVEDALGSGREEIAAR